MAPFPAGWVCAGEGGVPVCEDLVDTGLLALALREGGWGGEGENGEDKEEGEEGCPLVKRSSALPCAWHPCTPSVKFVGERVQRAAGWGRPIDGQAVQFGIAVGGLAGYADVAVDGLAPVDAVAVLGLIRDLLYSSWSSR